MHHVLLVVAVGEVVAHVTAATFLAVARGIHRYLGEVEQEAQLDGLEEVGVVALTLVVNRDVLVALAQILDDVRLLFERVFGAEHLGVAVHALLEFLTDGGHPLGSAAVANLLDERDDSVCRVLGQFGQFGFLGVFHGVTTRTLSEHIDVE